MKLSINNKVEVVYAAPRDGSGSCGAGQMRTYDRGDLDQMPASSVGFARAADGPGSMALDNQATIATALAHHNMVATATGEGGGSDGCALPGRARPALPLILVLVWAALRRRRRQAPGHATGEQIGRPR